MRRARARRQNGQQAKMPQALLRARTADTQARGVYLMNT